MKKLLSAVLAVVMCMAMLTACGTEAPASVASDAASVEASDVASAEASDVADVATLVVGTNAEFPPFEYLGDDGEVAGFEVDLLEAMAEKMGVAIEWQNMEFGAIVAAIGTKIDLGMSGMTITEERLQTVDFSEPYFEAVQYVMVAEGSDIATSDDLKNKVLGSQLGTTGNYFAEEVEGAEVKTYDTFVDAVNDLVAGRLDAVIIDKDPAIVFAGQNEGKVVALPGDQFNFEAELYGIAMPKGSEWAEKLNAALAEVKADGTYDTLYAEYFGN